MEEYGVPILIADALVLRVIDEKSIIRREGRAIARIREQGLREDFHIKHFVTVLKELPPRELYHCTLILSQNIEGLPTTTKEVPDDRFRVSLHHGGPHKDLVRDQGNLSEKFANISPSKHCLGTYDGGILVRENMVLQFVGSGYIGLGL